MNDADVEGLASGLLRGDRRALARGITLVESARPEDVTAARALVERVAPNTKRAIRIGVTGVPGSGKSTLLDAVGRAAVQAGRRVAVLAVDPSSDIGGGSILGDKTRMARLSALEETFVRPSPSGGALGGLAKGTREAALLCEAAGYDVVFCETLGVGQSEHAVAWVADMVLFVAVTGQGDELQWMKRGVLEFVDVAVVNKADQDGPERTAHVAAEIRRALSGLRRKPGGELAGPPPVSPVSALDESHAETLWKTLITRWCELEHAGVLAQRRRAQHRQWLRDAVQATLQRRIFQHAEVDAYQQELLVALDRSEITVLRAAEELVARGLALSVSSGRV